MTFAEKLIRLRKREGWSQEALAESLGVSRQAVSRWEQGTALPDAGKLLPCAKLFGVSVDWILDDGQDWEAKSQAAAPAKKPGLLRTILWSILIGISLLGVLLLGILSSVFQAVVTEAPAGVEWVHAYTGLVGFLKFYHLEWLFALCFLAAAVGILGLLLPRLRKKTDENPILRTNLVLLPILLQAGAISGCAQSLWWLGIGREDYRGLFWFHTAALLATSLWMAWNIRQEREPRQRRKNAWIELTYCILQAVVGLVMVDMGLGLVGTALMVTLGAVYILVINPRYMNRRLTRSKENGK